ncbi:MAG: S1C family serine protease [Clostridiales bacterium]|nr:S1C family serine protease [Clostridiales bacterium]
MPNDYYKNDVERFDPGRYYSDSAYTTPAESKKEKRHQRKSVLLAMLAGACIMATVASFVYMFFFYNVVFSPSAASDGETVSTNQTNSGGASPDFDIGAENQNGGMYITPPGTEGGHVLTVNDKYDEKEALSFKSIYRKCAPSVVSISVSNADFTKFVLGSGIIMSEDGYIVTNTHIVNNAGYINVKLYGGGEYPAYLVGADDASGIAVIKIETENLLPAEFGDSKDIEVGESVVSIGNPVEGSFSMTDGVISSLCGKIKYGGYRVTVFQTSAQSGSGSSGGPVINEFGQVVGIINTDMAANYDLENLSFAVPISDAKPIVDELLAHGYVAGRPALGLQLIDIPLSASAYYGMPVGVFVEKVYTNSDAYAQGIARGDIIVSINGVNISSTDELNEVKNELEVGDTVVLGVYRKRELYSVEVVLVDSSEFH